MGGTTSLSIAEATLRGVWRSSILIATMRWVQMDSVKMQREPMSRAQIRAYVFCHSWAMTLRHRARGGVLVLLYPQAKRNVTLLCPLRWVQMETEQMHRRLGGGECREHVHYTVWRISAHAMKKVHVQLHHDVTVLECPQSWLWLMEVDF